eukprot:9469224-Pyramimonas_sp.AAC.1
MYGYVPIIVANFKRAKGGAGCNDGEDDDEAAEEVAAQTANSEWSSFVEKHHSDVFSKYFYFCQARRAYKKLNDFGADGSPVLWEKYE